LEYDCGVLAGMNLHRIIVLLRFALFANMFML
jgi:hypothetical protein